MTSATEQYNTWSFSTTSPISTTVGGTGVSLPSGTTFAANGATGAPTLIAAAVSGATTVSIGTVNLYDSVSLVVGNVIRVVGSITFTATSTTPVLSLSVPFTGNFVDGNQAWGLAKVNKATSPGIGDGIVPAQGIASHATSTLIYISPVLVDNSSNYVLTFDISYFYN
jgi:hypothetical protein